MLFKRDKDWSVLHEREDILVRRPRLRKAVVSLFVGLILLAVLYVFFFPILIANQIEQRAQSYDLSSSFNGLSDHLPLERTVENETSVREYRSKIYIKREPAGPSIRYRFQFWVQERNTGPTLAMVRLPLREESIVWLANSGKEHKHLQLLSAFYMKHDKATIALFQTDLRDKQRTKYQETAEQFVRDWNGEFFSDSFYFAEHQRSMGRGSGIEFLLVKVYEEELHKQAFEVEILEEIPYWNFSSDIEDFVITAFMVDAAINEIGPNELKYSTIKGKLVFDRNTTTSGVLVSNLQIPLIIFLSFVFLLVIPMYMINHPTRRIRYYGKETLEVTFSDAAIVSGLSHGIQVLWRSSFIVLVIPAVLLIVLIALRWGPSQMFSFGGGGSFEQPLYVAWTNVAAAVSSILFIPLVGLLSIQPVSSKTLLLQPMKIFLLQGVYLAGFSSMIIALNQMLAIVHGESSPPSVGRFILTSVSTHLILVLVMFALPVGYVAWHRIPKFVMKIWLTEKSSTNCKTVKAKGSINDD